MRTQFIPEQALGLPWLEHFPAKGGPPEKTVLDKSPFIIGRGESADLQVVSYGVSREHASVAQAEGRATRIRDLGSTNGTFVNGQRVKEADLHDGDMVQVANVEFAFYCGNSQARQATVTQVLSLDAGADPDADGDADRGDPAGDLRRAVRRLHETLVSGCVQRSLEADRRSQAGAVGRLSNFRRGRTAGRAREQSPAAGDSGPRGRAAPPPAADARHRTGRGDARKLPYLCTMSSPSRSLPGGCLELAGMSVRASAGSQSPCDRGALLRRQRKWSRPLAPGGPSANWAWPSPSPNFGGRDAGTALLAEMRPDFVRIASLAGPRHAGNPTELAGRAGNAAGYRRERNQGDCHGNQQSRANGPRAWRPAANWAKAPLFEERKRPAPACRRVNLGGSSAALDAFYLSQALDSIERL